MQGLLLRFPSNISSPLKCVKSRKSLPRSQLRANLTFFSSTRLILILKTRPTPCAPRRPWSLVHFLSPALECRTPSERACQGNMSLNHGEMHRVCIHPGSPTHTESHAPSTSVRCWLLLKSTSSDLQIFCPRGKNLFPSAPAV